MSGPPRASIVHHEAWMGKPFGEELARKIFGNEVVDSLPRNTKGKWAGHHKATLRFRRVERGGWVSEGIGYVERRVGRIISAEIVVQAFRRDSFQVLHSKEAGRHEAGLT